MKIEEIRAKLLAITASLEEIVPGEVGFTEDQKTKVDELNADFEQLSAQLETAEKMEKMKQASASAGRKTQVAAPTSTTRVDVGASHSDKFGGFKSNGEFLNAVKAAGNRNEIDRRLLATATERVGEDGGFLVPEEMSQAILKKLTVAESLMSQATVYQVSGNSLTINVDESQPWNQGIQAYWTGEGATITDTKASFKQASWRLNKLAALVKCTDELLDDATALESYIINSAPEAFVNKINTAILSGNGAGKPQGIINSPFTYTVAKEGTQSADTIVAANVIKMYSRMFPQSRSKGVWLINPAVEDQLRLMVDNNDEYIYLSPGGIGGQLSASPYGTLLGRPVIPMMGSMPALGDLGDIMFVDLSYYYMIRKASGVKSATSIHLYFDKEITAYRFSLRLDGRCPFQAPVTTENGSFDMSAFVQLQAR